MRIRMGVMFLSKDTVTEDMDRVKIRPAFITMVFTRRLVTARVEQIPKICLSTGLSFQRPSLNIWMLPGGFGTFYYPFLNDPQSSLRKLSRSLLRKASIPLLVPVAPVMASSSLGPFLGPAVLR